jgi:gluconate 2-dehydrogenase
VYVQGVGHPDSQHLISGSALRLMKHTAVLVNISQGMVDESALAEALRNRTIFAAAVDVFEHEPDIHPDLLNLPNVILGAHCHSASRRLRAQRSLVAARDVIAGMSGRRPRNLVNAHLFESTQ